MLAIDKHKAVSLTYQLRDSEGTLIDEAEITSPFAFLHEGGQTLPAFDRNLKGLTSGEFFNFIIAPEEGYGEYNEEFIVDFPKAMFTEADIPEEMFRVGAYVPMEDGEGKPMEGMIIEIGDELVTVDFNHQLAGESLHFTGQIIEVRDATTQEIAHGHIHHGGHDH
jgi:FKBP-type peptidyl-prolyl cis-trans isomerase SlyD